MLVHRLVTGPLLIVAIVLLCLGDDALERVEAPTWVARWFGMLHWPPGSLLALLVGALVVPLGAREFARLLRRQAMPASAPLIAGGALLLAYALWAPPGSAPRVPGAAFMAIAMTALTAASLLAYTRGRTIDGVAAGTGATLLGAFYLGALPGLLLAIRHEHSAWVVLGILLAAKACDIGAYFTGRAVGRHRLIPWLSPGKTWEGLVGGVVGGALAGAGLALLSHRLPSASDHFPPLFGAVAGALFALAGQFGDLAESLLKRAAGAKDSGALLPGMGGLLDVLDSPLAAAPVAWLLLRPI